MQKKKYFFFHPKMSECQYFGLKSCLERQRKTQGLLLASKASQTHAHHVLMRELPFMFV